MNASAYEDNKCKIDKELVEILKGLDTEEEKMSAINTYMSADIIAMYMNETKKQRGIGGRKTKAIDIEKMSNEHIVGEENPHDHFMFAPYDPASVTGRFINPMAFSYTKQKVHIAFEKNIHGVSIKVSQLVTGRKKVCLQEESSLLNVLLMVKTGKRLGRVITLLNLIFITNSAVINQPQKSLLHLKRKAYTLHQTVSAR
ncbi:hypothetical protein ACPSKX_04140 [Moritella viscosa]